MTKKFTAIYMRVSTKDQRHASQEPDLQAWVKTHVEDGREVRWYREKYTGTHLKRPRWRELEEEILADHVAQLVVWRLDRLGRNVKDMLMLMDLFDVQGINFVSLKESIDMKTASGRYFMNILMAFAQYESELRSERVLAGLDAVTPAQRKTWKKRGWKPGTILTPPDKLKEMKTLVEAGVSIGQVSRMCNARRETIYKYIRQLGWKYEYKKPEMTLEGDYLKQTKGTKNLPVKVRPKLAPDVQDPLAAAVQKLLECA